MNRPDLFQEPAMRIVEALHDCHHYVHIVAQTGDLVGKPLQGPPDISKIDDRFAGLVAHDSISMPKRCLV
jgi:hypothetical protein